MVKLKRFLQSLKLWVTSVSLYLVNSLWLNSAICYKVVRDVMSEAKFLMAALCKVTKAYIITYTLVTALGKPLTLL